MRRGEPGHRTVCTMVHRYWPLFDLRLSIAGLALRPLAESDLVRLADLLPDDVEQDPAATRLELTDERTVRGTVAHQTYWKAWGTWNLDDWALALAVLQGDSVVGTQWLEGTDFRILRTVDTASMLRPDLLRTRTRPANAHRRARARIRAARSAIRGVFRVAGQPRLARRLASARLPAQRGVDALARWRWRRAPTFPRSAAGGPTTVARSRQAFRLRTSRLSGRCRRRACW